MGFMAGSLEAGIAIETESLSYQRAVRRARLNPDGGPADTVLQATIGLFKTPGLRDLGQSGPYLHTGRKREIEEVLEFYVSSAAKARAGSLRNAAPPLEGIFLGENDIDPLAAFLRSLNEDYN